MVGSAPHSKLAPARASTQPLYVLDTSHGLPSNQIHRIARDHHNRLWFAGPAGVASFDGSFVRTFDRRVGLHCNGLRCIAVSADSTVWIGTDLGLQALSDSGKPFLDSSPFLQSNGLCEDIVCLGRHLWVGAAQGLLRFEVSNSDLPARLAYFASIGFVESVAAVNEKVAYAASNRLGLIKSDGASWVAIESPLLNGRVVSKLMMGRAGEVWIGTDAGLFQLNSASDEVTPHHFRNVQDGTVTAIADGARELWVAFGNQLIAYPHEASTSNKPQVFEIESRINDLLVDDLDNIWIATDSSGLVVISCLRQAIERIDIGKDGAVFSIKARPNSVYVLGGEKLLQMVNLSDDDVASSVVPGLMPATTVWDSYHDGQGRWIAAQTGLFYAPEGGVYAQMFANHPVLGAPMRVLTPHRDAIWIGSLRGLVRLTNKVATEVRGHDDVSLGYVYTLIDH
jgi:ligand-binding sensor domain-containing protein